MPSRSGLLASQLKDVVAALEQAGTRRGGGTRGDPAPRTVALAVGAARPGNRDVALLS